MSEDMFGNDLTESDSFGAPVDYDKEQTSMTGKRDAKVKKRGWICLKCSNVYAPHVDCCQACNDGAGKSLKEALEDMRDYMTENEQASSNDTEPSVKLTRPDQCIPICAPARPYRGSQMDSLARLFNQLPENTEIDYNALEGIDAESKT